MPVMPHDARLWMAEMDVRSIPGKVDTFVREGLVGVAARILASALANSTGRASVSLLPTLVEAWKGFVGHCIPTLEACLLHLSMAWNAGVRGKPWSIRAMCLLAFWQVVVLPVHSQLMGRVLFPLTFWWRGGVG